MVTSNEKTVSGDADALPLPLPKADGLPVGNYRIVGWDLDFSGRRLVDEILQIAAYTPEKQFSLYMMPSRDLNLAARRRHKLKVVTIHRYRVLKHIKNNKPIKTKSEISGLLDFISWLEEVRGDAKDGIILVFHEVLNSCPALLLHCLGRYPHANLLDRFKAVVAGFANGFAIAESKCIKPVSNSSLRTLASTLLDKEESLESAADRARLTYQVLQKLCLDNGNESNEGAGDSAVPSMSNLTSYAREFTQPCRREEELLIQQQDMIKRQDALRPVFFQLMRGSRKERERAYLLRRNLVDAEVDMTIITDAWNSGQKEAVAKLLEEKAHISDDKDKDELLTTIEWHFVPELRPKTERRPSYSKRGRKFSKNADKNNDSVDDSSNDASSPTSESPDTTTITPEKSQSNGADTKDSQGAVAC